MYRGCGRFVDPRSEDGSVGRSRVWVVHIEREVRRSENGNRGHGSATWVVAERAEVVWRSFERVRRRLGNLDVSSDEPVMKFGDHDCNIVRLAGRRAGSLASLLASR
jgi:hypothetical protein